MPVTGIPTDTGLSPLPDIGELSYNGVVFSALFKSSLSCQDVKDEAKRTVIYRKHDLSVEGVVTLATPTSTSTDTVMADVRAKLEESRAPLRYQGGFGNLVVNGNAPAAPGAGTWPGAGARDAGLPAPAGRRSSPW